MTVLRDGTVVNESITAHNFTPAALVPAAFGQGKRRVEKITIHHWGLEGQNFDGVVGYLTADNPRGSSAHAVIMDKRASAIVSPSDAAWQAGDALGNTVSIGLECRPEATDGDYITVAAYIAMLREVYGDIPLVPHNYWKATACPGKWDLARLDRMARAGTPAIAPKGEVIEMAVFAPAEDWFNAMIQAQTRIDNAAARTLYVKGDKSDTIYDMTGGKLRGLTNKEWVVIELLGYTFKTVPQGKLDAFVAEYDERNPR